MTLSVVTTLYRSKGFLEVFLKEILSSIEIIEVNDFELIFVNDGSPDDSVKYLLERKKEISQIKIIDLSRNFGHHYAIQAGLNYASGEYVFLIDNDLESPPSVLVNFYNEIKKLYIYNNGFYKISR
jgi:putative glycosyltransferase